MVESSQQCDLVNNEDREALTLVNKDIIDRVSHAYLSLDKLHKELDQQRSRSRDLNRNVEVLESQLKESHNTIETLLSEKTVLNSHTQQILQKLHESECVLMNERKQANQKKLQFSDSTSLLDSQIQETFSTLKLTQLQLKELTDKNFILKNQLIQQRDTYEQELYSLKQHASKHKEEKLTLENSIVKLQQNILDKETTIRELFTTQAQLQNSLKTQQAQKLQTSCMQYSQDSDKIPSFHVDEGLINKLCEELKTHKDINTDLELQGQNLQSHLDALLHEIEQKAPVLAKKERDYDELVVAYNQLLKHRRIDVPQELLEIEGVKSELGKEKDKNAALVKECNEQGMMIKRYIAESYRARSDNKFDVEQHRVKILEEQIRHIEEVKLKLRKAEDEKYDLTSQVRDKDSKITHLSIEITELTKKLQESDKKFQQEKNYRISSYEVPQAQPQPEGYMITSELLNQVQDIQFYSQRTKDLEESVFEARNLYEKSNQEKEAMKTQLISIRQENTQLRSKSLISESEIKKLKSEIDHLKSNRSQLTLHKQELEQRLLKTQNSAFLPSLFQKQSSYKLDDTVLSKLSQTEKELSDTRKAWYIEVSKLKLELENYKLLASQNYAFMDMMEIEHIRSYSKKLNKIIKLMQKDNNLLISENENLIRQLIANEPARMSQEEISVLRHRILEITSNFTSLNEQVDLIQQDYINQIYSLQNYIHEKQSQLETEFRHKETLEETVADREQQVDQLNILVDSLKAQRDKANEIIMCENELYKAEFPPLPEEDSVFLIKAQNLKLRERIKQIEIKRMLEIENYDKLLQCKDQEISAQTVNIVQLDSRSKELDKLCKAQEMRLEGSGNNPVDEDSLHRLLSSIHAVFRLSMNS